MEDYIRRELEEAGVRYEVVYDGAVTRVVIGPGGGKSRSMSPCRGDRGSVRRWEL